MDGSRRFCGWRYRDKVVDCPRCASENDEGERFCWLCGWDFSKESEICDRCGLEIKKNGECTVCDPTTGWMPTNKDDR